MVDAARLSTPQLENICQSVLGASITDISNASTPAEQARDMVTYAKQYGELRKLAAGIIDAGSGRAGLQNLLLGNETMNQTEDQRHTAANSIEIVRLENRVGRVEDKLSSLENNLNNFERKIEAFLQRTPLNWNIVAWGVAVAIIVGSIVWMIATVN